MQILHVCPLPSFSGLEQYAFAVAKRQQELGLSVGFVCLDNTELQKRCQAANIPHFTIKTSGKLGLLRSAVSYSHIFAKHPELKVVHLHSSQDIDRIALALVKTKPLHPSFAPKLIQQNHIWLSHKKKDPIHWLTYRSLDEVWCSSEPARESLLRVLPVKANKIHIIKYGRDLEGIEKALLDRNAARRELGLPEDALVLGAIARLEKAKGVRELVEGSIPALNANPKLHVVVVGGPTTTDPKAFKYADDLKEFVANLEEPIRSRVHLPGQIADAARLLPAFDLFAQVSYKETFSLALLDAQLAGLPVLGTRSGGTPEVVKEGSTGWLCEPESVESLSAALIRALGDQEKWAQYGETARNRVKREFNFETVIQDIIGRYQLEGAAPAAH